MNPFRKTQVTTQVTTIAPSGTGGSMKVVDKSDGPRKASQVTIPEHYFDRMSTGITIMDELINGDGIVPGQQISLAAPRGSGKTTLLMQMMQGITTFNPTRKCIYLSGEEYVEQLAYTANRINTPDVLLHNETDIDTIATMTEEYDVMVIDSLPALTHPQIHSEHARQEYAVNTLVRAAKRNKCAIFYIMHFTKDGKEKGNSMVGHTVDTTLKIYNLDEETYGERCRCLEVEKNRFGSSTEAILRLRREGWDFTNPVDKKTSGNKGNNANSNRATQKLNEMNELVKVIRQGNKPKLNELNEVCGDVGRTERLLKDLEKLGRILSIGRGNDKYWVIGDDEQDDD
jgi:predicted ATP-dependent serine protease